MQNTFMAYKIQLPSMVLDVSADTNASNYKEKIRLRVIEHLQSLNVEEGEFSFEYTGPHMKPIDRVYPDLGEENSHE